MILSQNLEFSVEQSLSGSGSTVSTNIIDLGDAQTVLGAPTTLDRDAGKGNMIPVLVQLDADAGGTDPTLDVDLQVDADEAFSDPTTVYSAPQVDGGSDGDRVKLFWLPEGTNERYMRLNYTLGGTSPTYTVSAAIVAADQTND